MGTLTERLGLYKPDNGETGWGDEVDANFDVIDTRFSTIPMNVKDFGAVGDFSQSDASGAFQDAVDAAAGQVSPAGRGSVFIPDGAYLFASGASVEVPGYVRIVGSGDASIIYPENAYAFTFTDGGSNNSLKDVAIIVQGASTSGGGVYVGGCSGTVLENVHVVGSGTNDHGIHMTGVGQYVLNCQGNDNGGSGLRVDAASGFANHVKVIGGRYAGNGTDVTDGGVLIAGQNNVIRDVIVESNNGVGIAFSGTSHQMMGIWFEDNHNHNVYVGADASPIWIVNNYFASLDYGGAEAGATHIYLEDKATSANASCDQIIGNHMINEVGPTSLYIGTDREHTGVIGNRNLPNTLIDDNGTGTYGFGNWDPSNQGLTVMPDVFSPPLRVRGTTQSGDNSDLMGTGLFAISDSLDEDQFGIQRTGHAVFHTTNAPSASMPTRAFSFYWDEGASVIKAAIRKADGSTVTQNVT